MFLCFFVADIVDLILALSTNKLEKKKQEMSRISNVIRTLHNQYHEKCVNWRMHCLLSWQKNNSEKLIKANYQRYTSLKS